uniref:GAF domain-containing protein n=1 Tax=Macrostomum lignano TaxID=282301 RepID=A0A1I8IAM5_9PLAT
MKRSAESAESAKKRGKFELEESLRSNFTNRQPAVEAAAASAEMAAACCGLVRRRRNGNSKYQQQPLPHVGSQQPATNDFSRLHTVLCLTELQTAATEILADILPCRDIRFHYNEESPIVAGQVAETFSNGYLRVLASAQDLVHLDANSLRQPEAAAVFGSAPSGYQGIALPIREQGATHCLVTLVAPEVVEQHRMTLEAFKRQLETTCTRLVRLAAMGFPGAAGKQQQQSASSESGGPKWTAPSTIRRHWFVETANRIRYWLF